MALKKNDFLERSIMGALAFLKDSVFAEEYALKAGFLQSLDPRLKAVSFAVFFITVMFLRKIELIAFLYLFCLGLVVLSRINIFFFIKRTWFFIPLFSLFIAIPAVFDVFSPGETIVAFKFFNLELAITRQGLQGALLFVFRVLTSVSFIIVLSLTTRHAVLLKVLRIFKIPDIFVMTLGMCYRYIYMFVEIIENTYLSIKSRTGGVAHYKKGQRLVAWNIAYLWQRSFVLSQNVYSAMVSRGYRGEPVTIDDFKVRFKDRMWLLMVVLMAVFLVSLDNI